MLGKRVLLNWGGRKWAFSRVRRFYDAIFMKAVFTPANSLVFITTTMILVWGEACGRVKPNS